MNIPWSPISTPLAYLASPFTRYIHGHERAVLDISLIASKLTLSGVKLFCPIAHGYPLILYGGLDPIDENLWREINAPFLQACEILIVAMLDGWQDSTGVTEEIAQFTTARKRIFYLQPQTLLMTREREAA